MKVINLEHREIFSNISDMLYDFVIIDGEPLSAWDFLIEDMQTPAAFLTAVTAESKAFTYLSSIDLDALNDEYEELNQDILIVVNKNNKPWVTVLFSQLNW
jgi:hypothetical protein